MERKVKYLVGTVRNCDHRADRKTPLGNPFYMASEEFRDKVCDEFYLYFEKKILDDDSEIITELRRIKELSKNNATFTLGCHCFPRRCHLDTVTYFLNNFYNSI